MYQLDQKDRDILMYLQKGIPIASRPYQIMAEEIGNGLTEAEVISRIGRLKEENIIRRMSGFFNSNALGYKSTLVGVRPKEGRYDEAMEVINAYPGVTHNYRRDHDLSMWFTLIAINQATLDHILDTIEAHDAIDVLHRFAMEKRYKIDVTFALDKKEEGGHA